jgi:hypothetical protein
MRLIKTHTSSTLTSKRSHGSQVVMYLRSKRLCLLVAFSMLLQMTSYLSELSHDRPSRQFKDVSRRE